jgi:hypothetical protein
LKVSALDCFGVSDLQPVLPERDRSQQRAVPDQVKWPQPSEWRAAAAKIPEVASVDAAVSSFV